MRTMMKITIDIEAGSRAVADGTIGRLMEQVLGPLQPEAAYFGPEDGMRTAWIVFDLQDPSQLPALTEPLFRELKATVQMVPVMNQEDLQKGLQQLGQAG
jgi:hypothetical protein